MLTAVILAGSYFNYDGPAALKAPLQARPRSPSTCSSQKAWLPACVKQTMGFSVVTYFVQHKACLHQDLVPSLASCLSVLKAS